MSKKKVGMADIANELGVSLMTVSLSLRDNPKISKATREKVQAMAKKLGYVRDPEVGKLMAYIRNRGLKNHQGNLAMLHFNPEKISDKDTYLSPVTQAAIERAKEFGYSMDTISLAEPGMNPKRLNQIIRARNIQGVIVAPLPSGSTKKLQELVKFEDISGVRLGFDRQDPRFIHVNINHFQAMQNALDCLLKLGYKRVGIAIDAIDSSRVRNGWVGGFVSWQYTNFGGVNINPHYTDHYDLELIEAYIRDNQLDAILIKHVPILEGLKKRGFRVPEDLGVAFLNAVAIDSTAAGIDQRIAQIGRVAVEQLVSQILARNLGESEAYPKVLLRAGFRTGPTLTDKSR